MSLLYAAYDHATALLAGPTPTPAPLFENPPPKAPPGMEGTFTDWVSWAKYVGMVCGILGLIACGIMMTIGRRNRAHLSAEGASGLVWVIAGISAITLSVSVVTAMMG
ncbi:hypothetical protein [Streptomyces sp. NRRL WC-3742]|uniref:hypothetical protein n=1 Tax=Streptomyces sp. NRRL WC-3742 TaxID=1463934 RepID=UPI000A60409D|nr:hypothetical protein [Streptomyces sp. NRRL WC-3742]